MNVQPFLHNSRLTWTMTTNGYKFYTLNLIAWLREKARVPWTLCVICCDAESYSFFRREGIPCIAYQSQKSQQQRLATFGTSEFAKWNRIKLDLLHYFAENAKSLGITHTLYLDGDIVVQRDPWPVLEGAWVSPDLLFQCDCIGSEDHSNCGVICSGVIAHRISDDSLARLYEFEQKGWDAAEKQDQPYIGARLKSLGIPYTTLARSLWGNGEWQKSGRWREEFPEWVLLHYNYRMGDTKKGAMRTFGHWRIPY
jgi:hypothetical protein